MPSDAPPLTSDSPNPQPFRVLSLDGGGMRGLYTATILKYLTAAFAEKGGAEPVDIGKGFDLIVGTSTGGILATALAAGLPIDRIIELYENEGPKIFLHPFPYTGSFLDKMFWIRRFMNSPGNDVKPLKEILTKLFQNETLGTLYSKRKIPLCLTTVSMIHETAQVFKTGHIPGKSAHDGYRLVDICLGTSAAPIFLPMQVIANPIVMNSKDAFVDGGLWANNPILVSLVEALEMVGKSRPIEILSIGTRDAPAGEVIEAMQAERGLLKWQFGINALSVSMNAQSTGAQYMAGFLSKRLEEAGYKITIVRLGEAAVSKDEIADLGMDLSSQKSRQTLINLAVSDAKSAHRQTQGLEGKTLKNILERAAGRKT